MNKHTQNTIIVTSEFPPQPGGIGNHAYNLAKHLHANGNNVVVIADNRSIEGNLEGAFDAKNDYEVIRIKISKPRFLMYFKRIRALYRIANKNNTVIATGKFSLWNTALCSMLKKFRKIAVVHGTEVNFTSSLKRSLVNSSLKRFDTIVAVSNFTKGLVDHLHSQIYVVPNGINFQEWSKQIKTPNITSPLKLITVGRISERKGQHVVVKHLKALKHEIPDIEYHCVGMDVDSQNLTNQIDEMKLNNNVFIHGVLSHQEMMKQLSDSTIFIMLSTETQTGDVEGFGIAILEANALGLPAIGAKGSGIEDAIENEYSGILINEDSDQELLKAINEIIANYKQYSENALLWAKKHDWNNIIKSYQKLLD